VDWHNASNFYQLGTTEVRLETLSLHYCLCLYTHSRFALLLIEQACRTRLQANPLRTLVDTLEYIILFTICVTIYIVPILPRSSGQVSAVASHAWELALSSLNCWQAFREVFHSRVVQVFGFCPTSYFESEDDFGDKAGFL
jgi:hypothetical protein